MKLWQNKFMEKITSIFFLMFFISLESLADQTFYLSCKVLDQNIYSMNEGKSEKFSGFKKGIKQGEIFTVEFDYSPLESGFELFVTIPGELHGYNFDNYNFNNRIYINNFDVTYEREVGIRFDKGDLLNSQRLYVGFDKMTFKDDFSSYDFKRYYKNDWQLLFFYGDLTNFHTGTANCMGMPNTYDEVLKSMQEIYE